MVGIEGSGDYRSAGRYVQYLISQADVQTLLSDRTSIIPMVLRLFCILRNGELNWAKS